MERVGLVALSIAVATMLLVGASYSAQWLQPYFENITLRWSVIGFGALLPAAAMLLRRAHHSK